MGDHKLIQLGMFVNELERLQSKYGLWLQGAEVYSPESAEPIAQVSAGGGSYCVTLTRKDNKL